MINITLSKLFQLPDEEIEAYLTSFKFVKGKRYIADSNRVYTSRDLGTRPYAEVKEIIQLMSSDVLKAYSKVFHIEIDELLKKTVTDFMPAHNWLKDQIEMILKNERVRLRGKKNSRWIQAGAERLAIFGELNVLLPIAEQFNTTVQDVEKWSYNYVFALQYRQVMYNEIMEEYNRLVTEK